MKKPTFNQYNANAPCKVNKGFAIVKKLRRILQQKSLLTIYKAFFKSLIDYGNIFKTNFITVLSLKNYIQGSIK